MNHRFEFLPSVPHTGGLSVDNSFVAEDLSGPGNTGLVQACVNESI